MGRAFQNRKESMAKTAATKTRIYSKYGRVLYVCAKQGGADPSGNLALRSLIDRAKRDQVPAHVIERALDKAKGSNSEDYAVTRYEGFGPQNSVLIVDCLTDNANRTIGEVRGAFTKTKNKLGTPGTVSHQFDHNAVFAFEGSQEETVLDALMNADVDVDDIEDEDGLVVVYAAPTDFAQVKQVLTETLKIENFELEEIQFIAKENVQLDEENRANFERLLEMLNDLDDVQHVYHNVAL